MSQSYTGGCACGALRYATAHAPVFQNHCQCRDCQRRSGTGHGSYLTFPARAEMVTVGFCEPAPTVMVVCAEVLPLELVAVAV